MEKNFSSRARRGPLIDGLWSVERPREGRLWLGVQLDERPTKIVTMPPEAQEVLVVRDRSTGSARDDVNVIMPFGAPSCMALMGYLHRGQVPGARTLGRQIFRDATHGELDLSDTDAAVLGYYLLRVAPHALWKDSYPRFSEKHAYSADGRVLQGLVRDQLSTG